MSVHEDEWGKIEPEDVEDYSCCNKCKHGRIIGNSSNRLFYCRKFDEEVTEYDYFKEETEVEDNVCSEFIEN